MPNTLPPRKKIYASKEIPGGSCLVNRVEKEKQLRHGNIERGGEDRS